MAKKILLADDSITIQKVVELTFSDGDYEVTAVNNGAKAIQKLGEMRPDIILSDIIMPEKNGYEVCEFVKSHPDYRNIPVVLLTGTFEPFDPDRADKAGCDAVVTKPFESQSLIHKVEELIASSRANAPAPAAAAPEPEPEPAPSPWMDEPAAPVEHDSPFAAAPGFSAAPGDSSFASTSTPDIFGGATAAPPTTEIPYNAPPSSDLFGAAGGSSDAPAFSGETRAFPKMSFDELAKMADESPSPSSPAAPSPWDAPAPAEHESPFGGAPAADEFAGGGETRAFPRMSFDELSRMAEPSEPEPPAVDPTSPWEEPVAPAAFGGETRAFPKMSFDEMQRMADEPPAAAPLVPEATSPWDEPAAPAFSGETRAFPKMSFEDMQAMASGSASAPEPSSPWDEPAAPAWSPASEPAPSFDTPSESFSSAAAPSYEPAGGAEEVPFASSPSIEETLPPAEEPAWASAPLVAEPDPHAPAYEEEPVAEPAASSHPVMGAMIAGAVGALTGAAAATVVGNVTHSNAALTDEDVDRIARRVVQLMSEQVVRNIAWEVIPDLAEAVVKERIRQLEAEA